MSYESGGVGSDNPGSGKCRGDGRRPLALPPTLKEASKRSIVVPKVTRALARTMSEQTHTQQSLQPTSTAVPPPPSKGQVLVHVLSREWLWQHYHHCSDTIHMHVYSIFVLFIV